MKKASFMTMFIKMSVLVFLGIVAVFNCSPPGGGGGGTEKVATPQISPSPGEIQQDVGQITISCSTSGATIYYTLDGSDPTIGSSQYT